MAKHNYSQYSNKNKTNREYKVPAVEPVAEPVVDNILEPVVVPVVEPMVETVETVTLDKMVKGVVTGCAKLNVRAEPNTHADVVCVLDADTEIEVDVNNSNNEWFKICTAIGMEGYCMRKYVVAWL